MTSKKTTTSSTTARPTCSYPGCDQLAAPAEHPGRAARVLRRTRPHPRIGMEGTPAAKCREERHHDQRGRRRQPGDDGEGGRRGAAALAARGG